MNDQPSQKKLEQMADALAEQLRERSIRETMEAAEQLRAISGEDTDPFTARLLEEALEDFSHLPDYTEALFRRRAARALRPEPSKPDVVAGQARPVNQNPALPAGSKRSDGDG